MALDCKLITLISIFGLINSENQIIHSLKANTDFGMLRRGVANVDVASRTQPDNVDGFPLGNDIPLDDFSGHSALKASHSKLDQVYEALRNQVAEELEAGDREKYEELANHVTSFSSPFQGCANDSYPSSESGNIKTFQINLDAKPEDRWVEVVRQKNNELKNLANFFQKKFGQKFVSVVDKYVSWLHGTLPQEYFLELSSIAEAVGISVGRVTLFNIFYEFSSVCTSIIMEGEDGRMYHGRNLDFGMFMGWDPKHHTWFLTEILRPLIVKLEFIKGGKKLYSAVTYAGYTGILTGLKKHQFSLTIDERFKLNGGFVGLTEWILGRRDLSWLGLLTRRVMESAETYQQAQQMLASTSLVAPVYFILAGNSSGQGCIITRGRRNADVWELGSRHTEQTGTWYLLETNYDHWRQTPWFDHRRYYAVQCMDQLGRHRPLDTLYRVLSTRPVLNKETTLTALMDLSAGQLQVWERDCGDPCWPF